MESRKNKIRKRSEQPKMSNKIDDRAQFWLYNPTSENWKSRVQFEFLHFAEKEDSRFTQELQSIYERWRDKKILPRYELLLLSLKMYGYIRNLGVLGAKFNKIHSFSDEIMSRLEMTADQSDNLLKQNEDEMNNSIEPDKMTSEPNLQISDYRQILEDNELLDDVNIWMENWNFGQKDWFYRWIVLKFQTWAQEQSDSQFFYNSYVIDSANEFGSDFPPPKFIFLSPSSNRSLRQYSKMMRIKFENVLKKYMDKIKIDAKEKGYVKFGKPRNFMRDIEWYYLAFFKRQNDATIAGSFGVKETTVMKARQRLKKEGDLP